MRRLRQPGPVPAERIESVAGHGCMLEFMLESGLALNEALTRPLVAAGMAGGTLTFADAVLAPFSYVLPGPSKDAAHAAYFSAPRSPGEARIEIANATFGQRNGAPFVHCHAAWTEPDGARRGGHILPHETIVAARTPACAWAMADVAIAAEPDAETNFILFHPVPIGVGDDGASMVAARIRPNQEIGVALEQLCRRHGFGNAVVRGSLGSLIGARFADGRMVADYATEVLVRRGEINVTGEAALEMLVVDMQGSVHEGLLLAGENAVCITFELMIERA
jgi:predicted DNA-binding protein with PD1-like motif